MYYRLQYRRKSFHHFELKDFQYNIHNILHLHTNETKLIHKINYIDDMNAK